jgi:hypothetical protein
MWEQQCKGSGLGVTWAILDGIDQWSLQRSWIVRILRRY